MSIPAVLPRRADQRERAGEQQLVEDGEEGSSRGQAAVRHLPLHNRPVQMPSGGTGG